MSKRRYVISTVGVMAGLLVCSASISANDMTSGAKESTPSVSELAPTDKQLTPQRTQNFSRWDTNGDGFIDKDEARQSPALMTKFNKADSNRDKRLDEGEFARFEVIDQDDEMDSHNEEKKKEKMK